MDKSYLHRKYVLGGEASPFFEKNRSLPFPEKATLSTIATAYSLWPDKKESPKTRRARSDYLLVLASAATCGDLKTVTRPTQPQGNHFEWEIWENVEVTREEFARWLRSQGQPLPKWWFPEGDVSVLPRDEPPPAIDQGRKFGRREQQIQAILTAIEAKDWDPLAVPQGRKKVLCRELCTASPELFTPDGFNNAWKKAGEEKRIQIKDIERFRRRN